MIATAVFLGSKGNSMSIEHKETEQNPSDLSSSEEEWRARLTPERFEVLRRKGTEPAFSGAYHDMKTQGNYVCAGCGQDLFHSGAKFDSGTGWPSFYAPLNAEHVSILEDDTHGTVRTEVVCSGCAGHLGHVFKDGPEPTGLRYCINSVSLRFVEDEGS